VVVGQAAEKFDADGVLTDPEIRVKLAEAVAGLVAEAMPHSAAA
jgi:hypothetical protein